ncbi:hypothetical protein MNL04_06730 [Bartonella krasnovii]|uniref:hypothetical protein n=1 Tax=Bartonella krasnovii TaxID=2267275 RepID=UPI001F4C8BEA|nr:hypothetical protein [Bartonella krasnovii]UNF48387.1 hypothetical protein MNL04_06730 [Bartonella krasnovii]
MRVRRVPLEGKDALFDARRSASSRDWVHAMRVRRVPLEGKDALFDARRSASSYEIGYMP